MSNNKLFWLRSEVKEGEKRTPLLPQQAQSLIALGHSVNVERSTFRCVSDAEYEAVGCTLVPTASWTEAPKDAIILGLKELPENNEPITHTQVYFAHCFKNQAGWQEILQRFKRGNGLLWDLEFLTDATGRRVAAFGRSAGFIGAGLGLKQWCLQQTKNETLGSCHYYADSDAMIREVKNELGEAVRIFGRQPRVIVVGALGRSGRGAVDFVQRVGLSDNVTQWDIEETRPGGPFPEILDYDIFINCIFLASKIPPFITTEMLANANRNMTVLVDVSCDTSNPNNPVPIYNRGTTFAQPTLRVVTGDKPVDVIAIDHLPSLIPLESSIEFATALYPHLVQIGETDVWKRAENLFHTKMASATSN